MESLRIYKIRKRFHKKFKIINGCWIWQYGKCRWYGKFGIGTDKSWGAHRVSLWLIGKLESLESKKDKTDYVDHICRNKACVNPDHLRVVTARINAIENNDGFSAINYRKTHCVYGHEFTKENTYYREKNNCRHCRKCGNIRDKKYKESLKCK